jgi:predicted dehydrogenase
VLCEARMAMNSIEAHEMLDASLASPDLIAQIVPPPHLMPVERHLIDLISGGYVGNIVHVDANIFNEGDWPHNDAPVHWRHDRDLSGNNVMTLGIWYENLLRLVGEASAVQANAQTVVKWRKDASGNRRSMTIPDQMDVIYTLAQGGTVNLSVSTVLGAFRPPFNVWVYGDQGTIHITSTDFSNPGGPKLKVMGGKRGDKQMSEITVPAGKVGGWRVEEEFINAVKGIEPVTRTNFTDGVKYMEFTDAVQQSWQSGDRVTLPL